MKHILAVAIVLGLVSGAAMAEEKKASCPMAGSKKACTCKGTVEKVNAAANTISLKTKKGEVMEFTIAEATKVTKGGRKATLADIVVGDTVDVKCKGEDVVFVKAKAAKVKKADKAKKEKEEKDKDGKEAKE